MSQKYIEDCPNGESNCPIYSEIRELRDKVSVLSNQVRTDFLTSLFNKQHLLFSLEQEMERTHRTNQPTTLLLIDIDKFKNLNDTYGHIVGDKALVHLGNIIKETVRKIDIPCRYGGEEFAVILPSTPLDVGINVAERLRQRIESTELLYEADASLSMTASIGVDTHLYHMPINIEQFIQRTDTLLYQAKSEGRNRVCHGDLQRTDITTVSSEEKNALFGKL